MQITNKKVVAVSYSLEVEGKTADSAGADAPLEYIHGTGMLIPGFEAALAGKEPGDAFDFVLSPAESYGEYHPEHCFDIPLSSFEVDGKLREDLLKTGAIIPMLNGSGQVVQGKIAAIGTDTVTMDFNHPMAGKTLHFTGKVEAVRDATEKELEEGLHGEFLPPQGCHCKHGKGHCKEGHCKEDGECGCGGDCNCGEGCDCGEDCSCN